MATKQEQLLGLVQQVRSELAEAISASTPLVQSGQAALPTLSDQLKPLVEPYLVRWKDETPFLEQQLKVCDELITSLQVPAVADLSLLMDRSQRLFLDLERQSRLTAQERDQLEPLLGALAPSAAATMPTAPEERAKA